MHCLGLSLILTGDAPRSLLPLRDLARTLVLAVRGSAFKSHQAHLFNFDWLSFLPLLGPCVHLVLPAEDLASYALDFALHL